MVGADSAARASSAFSAPSAPSAPEAPGAPSAHGTAGVVGAGRFAPSPSGALHLGNLRTALIAWLFARSSGRRFLIRLEDLDRVAPGAADRQLADLAALGIDHDGVVVRQSERGERYDAAVDALVATGMTYECFCTRREIREAVAAPHAGELEAAGRYPGTCRHLSSSRVAARRRTGRPPALRLRTEVAEWTIVDQLHGRFTGPVDDVVLRRNDGLAAYNLAVVVDDAAQGVDQVVRGEDLLPVTPAQAYLGSLLGLPGPEYAHVPLALNTAGARLAKRDGAVTLGDLDDLGWTSAEVLALLARSLGIGAAPTAARQLLPDFEPTRLPRRPWVVDPAAISR